MKIEELNRHFFNLVIKLIKYGERDAGRRFPTEYPFQAAIRNFEFIRERLEEGDLTVEKDFELCFRNIIRFSIFFEEDPDSGYSLELGSSTPFVQIIVDYLNSNVEFKKNIISGYSGPVDAVGLIEYFNMRSTSAIAEEFWNPKISSYHKYVSRKDNEDASWTEIGGVIVMRHLKDAILMRGDTRAPEEVAAAGGFSPALPGDEHTDRRNELALPELRKSFPLRISFTNYLNVAQRYMHNAAQRQGKQFSYLYYVNVKNMETIDLNLNLMEGRIGRGNTLRQIEFCIKNWVEEIVVLGSNIPINRITKIEKYEIIPRNMTSTNAALRHGFVLRGVYTFDVAGHYDYKETPFYSQTFKYQSAAMVSFNAKKEIGGVLHVGTKFRPPKKSVINDPCAQLFENEQVQNIKIESLSKHSKKKGAKLKTSATGIKSKPKKEFRPETKEELDAQMVIQKVQMDRWHESLSDDILPLVSVNYDLEKEEQAGWSKTISKLRCGFQNLRTPAKIYVEYFAHESGGIYSFDETYDEYYHISPGLFAFLMAKSLPIHTNINFHLIGSYGDKVASELLETLIGAGFKNCFVTSYTGKVVIQSEGAESVDFAIRIKDISTAERMNYRDILTHRRNRPEMADNKVITYWSGGGVRQMPYQQWIKTHIECYDPEQRKNLWIYSNIAILVEITHWLYAEVEKIDGDNNLVNILMLISKCVMYFQSEMFNANYNEQILLCFIIGIFKSLDLLVEENDFAGLNDSYGKFRQSILPIVPIELEAMNYQVSQAIAVSSSATMEKFFRITRLKTSPIIIVEHLLQDEVLDFSSLL